MSPTKETKKIALITRLNGRSDWTPWFDDIARIAKSCEIWECVNPDSTIKLEDPGDPEEPPEPSEGWKFLPKDAQKEALEIYRIKRQIWADWQLPLTKRRMTIVQDTKP